MKNGIALLLFGLVVAVVFLPHDALSGNSTKNNRTTNTTAKGEDIPSAAMGLRTVYVKTDGGVSYDLNLSLNEFVTTLIKLNKTTVTKWKKVDDSFWVLTTSGRDPMTDELTNVNYGFKPIAENPKYILLTAINMKGQAAMPNEIVVFGLVVAKEHNPNYSY